MTAPAVPPDGPSDSAEPAAEPSDSPDGDHVEVVIVGGGPNGLMLAAELALAGVRPLLLERRSERATEPRANAVVGQVVRLLDHRGLYERARGEPGAPTPVPAFLFGALPLDLAKLTPHAPTDAPADAPAHLPTEAPVPSDPGRGNSLYALGIRQAALEELLEERARELGVDIRRGHHLLDLDQSPGFVTARVQGPAGPYPVRARYLVGCDGAHSTVRGRAGIDFPGVTHTDVVSRSAHAVVPGARRVPGTVDLDVPGVGRLGLYAWYRTERGAYALLPAGPEVLTVVSMEFGPPPPDTDAPMSLRELRESLRRVLGRDLPLAEPDTPGPHLLRRLVGRNTRLAEQYRKGRVLLAGDAAHVHSAVGAPGLNLGLQDVANLAWKLAAQLHGWAPPGLLDSYHAERYPAAERVTVHSQAQLALMAPGEAVTALREVVAELLQEPGATRRIADLLSGADVRHDPRTPLTGPPPPTGPTGPPPHPWAGRFVPDLRLTGGVADAEQARLVTLLRGARPLLLDLTGDADLVTATSGDGDRSAGRPVTSADLAAVVADWHGRVDLATAPRPAAPVRALLLRPDGYVAWAVDRDDPADPARESLRYALTTWFGEPTTGRPTPGVATSG